MGLEILLWPFLQNTVCHVYLYVPLSIFQRYPLDIHWHTPLKYISFAEFVVAKALENERTSGTHRVNPLRTPKEQLPLLTIPNLHNSPLLNPLLSL